MQGRGHAALGRVVHRVDGRQLAGDLDLGQDAEAGRSEEGLRPPDDRGAHAPRQELRFPLARDDGGPLERHALGQHDRVADARTARRHELVLGHLAQHRAGDHDAVEAVGDLGVPAHERDVELVARRVEIREEPLDRVVGGPPLGQEERREEPARARAAHRDVVGVHLEGVARNVVGRERDRVRRRDEVAVAEVDDRGVLADLRPHDDTGVLHGTLVEERLERRCPEFPDGQAGHGGDE